MSKYIQRRKIAHGQWTCPECGEVVEQPPLTVVKHTCSEARLKSLKEQREKELPEGIVPGGEAVR